MLWDPESNTKDEDGEGDKNHVSVTPILVPVQNKATEEEKSVPVLVPDVQDLKDQFQQQQNMLAQIKETLKQNESQLTSREKQVEVYANKLSQIRARTKNTQGKKTNQPDSGPTVSKSLIKRASKENLAKSDNSDKKPMVNSPKTGRKVKISELKKCLEENKIKFEQRTGKEQTETKKIETMVEQLKSQLEERDKTIRDLQKTIEQPKTLPRRTKKSETVASKMTQTHQAPPSDETNEITALQNKIYELEANVLDLEENLKEKESVIEARTQAVTLLSQDLSLKGKNTLENLEETRQEMRIMQNNFIAIEDELKKDLAERDKRLMDSEEKYKKLQSTNFDLSLKNAELQEKLVKMQERYAEIEAERNSSAADGDKSEETLKKIATLTKELEDRNKAMIKMKIDHKNKMKSLNATLESLKGASDDKAEIFRLSRLVEDLENVKTGLENRVAELEDEKGNHLLSVLDVDDLKASEKKLKDQINELEIVIQRQKEDLCDLQTRIETLETEKSDLIRSNQDQNALIEDLYGKLIISGDKDSLTVGDEVVDGRNEDSKYKELKSRFDNMEAEYSRKLENMRIDHGKEIEMLESYYNSKIENSERRQLEEYRISTEINNIHVEEQIELLIREKQQLLEKLKSLSGVSSMDSLTFEKVERSDFKSDKEPSSNAGEDVNISAVEEAENRVSHLQRIVNDQQNNIGELEKLVQIEREKTESYEAKIKEMTEKVKTLESANAVFQEEIKMSGSTPGERGKNQKSNFNAKIKVKKMEMELAETKRMLAEESKKVDDLNEKLKEKEELIRRYTEKIEGFEKDDWDRQNHWQNKEEDVENVQELQKKCLSLENSLMELNDEFERLRKENIELVHLLSEEKVKRRKMLEEMAKREEEKGNLLESGQLEEKIQSLSNILEGLEGKVEALENIPSGESVQSPPAGEEEEVWGKAELEQKLEWTNVVLTSKETEIFRIQNLLEDRNKAAEVLESDLNDTKTKLEEKEKMVEELLEKVKILEAKVQEVSLLMENVNEESNKTSGKLTQSEAEVQTLLAQIKELETNLTNKSLNVDELQGAIKQKNIEIDNLKGHFEGMINELTKNYEDRLEKMDGLLKSKEADLNAILLEKNNLEVAVKDLMAERDVIHNQKTEMSKENEMLRATVSEKEKCLAEMNEKLKRSSDAVAGTKPQSQEMEDLKTKMKKLAANLKKKAQNEADLMKQLKDLETSVAEKDKLMEMMKADICDVTEKWTLEKSEKEQVRNELMSLESESSVLKEKFMNLNKELEERRLNHENQVKQLQEEIQKSKKFCNDFQTVEQQYKEKLSNLEKSFNEVSAHYQETVARLKGVENALDEERNVKEEVLKKLAEITGKYEEMKFRHDQVVLEKTQLENKLEELQRIQDGSATEKTVFDAKLQENLAVIENLESELTKAQDHVKYVEEKLFVSEERRMSLENKNEEMCRRITEDSQNLMTIDDLANRVDELLLSEKNLLESVKNLESNNADLKQSLDEVQSVKQNLEGDVKGLTDKVLELTEELRRLKDVDMEKATAINTLTKEVDRTKAENKQILGEYDKLNRDYEQFEVDFKENLENSQNIEKNLRHKIEELTSENASLLEKLNVLSEDKLQVQEKEGGEGLDDSKKRKKKKSVTFRTDEAEYIKELKEQLHAYDANLKKANQEIESLKTELLQERIKEAVSNVVAEAESKVENLKSVSEPMFLPVVEPSVQRAEIKSLSSAATKPKEEEKKFDASMFFGEGGNVKAGETSFFDVAGKLQGTDETCQNSDFDSLMWDDGWGTDGHLEDEYLAGQMKDPELSQMEVQGQYEEKIKFLESEIDRLKGEVDKLSKDLEDQTAKYTKALKKIKEQKIICEKLQSEMGKLKKDDGLGDLNATIMDELKSQIEGMEKKEKEYLKALENHKSEKECLLKKIDVLNVEKEKFLEMKERQNNDVEIWQEKNNELLREIAEFRQNLAESQGPVLNDSALAQQNRDLMNKLEALEWKNCELTQLIEEKEELLEEMSSVKVSAGESGPKETEEKSALQKEIEELKNVKELLEKRLTDEENKNVTALDKLNEQLTALANENETLQDILGEMKAKGPGINDSKIASLKQKVLELEDTSRAKDAEIDQLKCFTMQSNEELMGLRQKVYDLESEKEMDNKKYRESLLDMEKLLKQKEEELQRVMQERSPEKTAANFFETIDLSQTRDPIPPVQDPSEELRQKILELEDLLRLREETLVMHSTFVQDTGKEMEELKEKNFQLEEFIRSKEEELNALRSMTWNQNGQSEVEELRTKVRDLEEFLRFKENEIYQIQTVKGTEIQNLNMRIFELENFMKTNGDGLQEKVYDLENVVRLREEECERVELEKSKEIENMRQKIVELENLLGRKTEEVDDLMRKLAELEKSYNDSKIEIERLLNEEKLNSEEKFVEPFQNNIQIPVAFELEAISRSLDEEKQKADNLQYELSDKDKVIGEKSDEIEHLIKKVADLENRLKSLSDVESRQKIMAEESYEMKTQLEKIITDLQKELDSSNLQLTETRRELEQYQNTEDEVRSSLKSQIVELETVLMESTEKKDSEILELKSILDEKTNFYESLLQSKRDEEMKWVEKASEVEGLRGNLEREIERLRFELASKERETANLTQLITEERNRLDQMSQVLEERDRDVADLKETLTHMQVEIASFRNFEKQIKELRMAQLKEVGSDLSVTPEGNPDLSGWTEHELAELSMKLQSDLDTALYMLHQRDVRCDELTFELMQLIEERDTLQLRLSNALRLNEEMKCFGNADKITSGHSLKENKDLVDQSNDRQDKRVPVPEENLQQLAKKISELHSTSYLKDKTVKDDSVQRHAEQMNLLSRLSDSDVALGRDGQSPPTALLNWMRGKSTPKVMHI